jgi:CheY-like chemotaxis protein
MTAAPPLVLVVDDVLDTREVHEHVLRAEGFVVETAASAEDALAFAARLRPAAIVLDFGLPGMDGWEARRPRKAGAATPALPRVAVTGHDTGEARDRAERAGVAGYLVKPCAPEDLVAELRRVLARPRV